MPTIKNSPLNGNCVSCIPKKSKSKIVPIKPKICVLFLIFSLVNQFRKTVSK